MFSGNWRLCHPVNIHVFRNGVEGVAPVLVHIPSDMKRSMDAVLRTIGERVKFSVGYPFALYHMNGCRVYETYELDTYGHYVVSSNLDKYFRCVCYQSRIPLVVVGPNSKNVRNIGNNTMKDILRLNNKENTKLRYSAAYSIQQNGFGPLELPYLTRPNRECKALCHKIKKYGCCEEIKDPCDSFPLQAYCVPIDSDQYYDIDEVEYRLCDEKGDMEEEFCCPEPPEEEECCCPEPPEEEECCCPEPPEEEECCCPEPPKDVHDCIATQTECTRPDIIQSEMCTQTIRDSYQHTNRYTQSEGDFCDSKPPPAPNNICQPEPQVIHCVEEVRLPAIPEPKPPMSHAAVNTETVEESQPECVVKVVNRKLDIGADLYRMFNCRLLSDNPPPVSTGISKAGSSPVKDTRVSDDFYRKFYDKLNETMPSESDLKVTANTSAYTSGPDPFSSDNEYAFTIPDTGPRTTDEVFSSARNQIVSSAPDGDKSEDANIKVEASYTILGENEINESIVEAETDASATEEETDESYFLEGLPENLDEYYRTDLSTANNDAAEYGAPPDNFTGESISAILASAPPNPDGSSGQEASAPSTMTTPNQPNNPNNPNTYFMTLHQMNSPFRISSTGQLEVKKLPAPYPQMSIYGTPHGDYFPGDMKKIKGESQTVLPLVGDCASSATEVVHEITTAPYSNDFEAVSSSDDDCDVMSLCSFTGHLSKPISLVDERQNNSQDSNRYADIMLEYLSMVPSTCGANLVARSQLCQSDDSYAQFSESQHDLYCSSLISSESEN